MIIVDEAHHLPAKQWSEIVQRFRPNAKVVFFTATPNHADGREITKDHTLSIKGCAYKLTCKKPIDDESIRKVNMKSIEHETYGMPPQKRIKLAQYVREVQEARERMFFAVSILAMVKENYRKKITRIHCQVVRSILQSLLRKT